jgi:hypothetical protein
VHPLTDHHCASSVHAVDLKNRLRDIENDRANLARKERLSEAVKNVGHSADAVERELKRLA